MVLFKYRFMKKFIIARQNANPSNFFISHINPYKTFDKSIPYYLLRLEYRYNITNSYTINVEKQALIDPYLFNATFNSTFTYNEELIKDTVNLLNCINFTSGFSDRNIIEILVRDITSFPDKYNELFDLFTKKSYDIDIFEKKDENFMYFESYLKEFVLRGCPFPQNNISTYLRFFHDYYPNFYSIIRYQQNRLIINKILDNPVSENFNVVGNTDKNKERIKSEHITFKNIKKILYDNFDRDDIKEILDCLEKELSKCENKVGETK